MLATRGRALDTHEKLLARVQQSPGVWTVVDFLDLAPRAAVAKTLQRLVHEGLLVRLDRGLYYLPRVNSLTGRSAVPDHNAVIDAVARRDQSRVVIDGLTAANDLGLTTAVPAKITVLTDARLRPIQLGKQQIRFQSAAPSRLYWAGHPAMRIVQALHWSKDLLDSNRPAIIRRLKMILSDETHGPALRDDLTQGLHTLPIWMQSVVRELLNTESQVPSNDAEPTARASHKRTRNH